MSVKNAEKLLQDIENIIDNWNERSQFTLKGIKNISRSDLSILKLYAKTYIRNNAQGFAGLMEPHDYVAQVLDKYNIRNKK